METELQQAERVARRWSDWPSSYVEARLLSRVFLAQQARLAEVERERDAWKFKAESEGIRIKWRDEERAAAERKATELERERDAWKDGKFAAVRRAEAAERKATEAAREQQKAWVAGVRWMCEKFAEAPEVVRAAFTPDKGDIVFYCGERIENIAATLYPAPTEREAAQECPCGRVRQLCGTVGCSNPANRPTPPQAAPEPRIAKPSAQVAVGHKMVQRWESDGFGRTWYRVVQKDYPNRDYGDFRAVLHALMSNPPMPTADEYAALLRLAGVPVPEEGGR